MFDGNSASIGGGVHNDAAVGSAADYASVISCLFVGNSAGFGGAMAIRNLLGGSYGRVRNCTFTGNSASSGGGIYRSSAGGTPIPKIVNSIFWDNSSDELSGIIEVANSCIEGGLPPEAVDGGGIRHRDA